MPTVIAHHEINDSEQWLASPKREEVFSALGVTHRTFLDPTNPTRAAVLLEVPDMDAFQEAMQSQDAADAMAHDGVNPETLVILVES